MIFNQYNATKKDLEIWSSSNIGFFSPQMYRHVDHRMGGTEAEDSICGIGFVRGKSALKQPWRQRPPIYMHHSRSTVTAIKGSKISSLSKKVNS